MALNEMPAVSKKGLPTPSPNLTVRMTPECRQWLDRAALHCRMTVLTLLDFATITSAKQHGFDEPAPKRQGDLS